MPLPLIPIVAALASGGTLVPHAAGGMIVTAASGYVTGTYISTTAVASIMTATTTTLGVGVAALTGVFGSIIGSAGIFGTTIGASGLTGLLMSAGILSATPIALPIGIFATVIGSIYIWCIILKLNRKLRRAKTGEEVQFTALEAKIIELLVKWLCTKNTEV
ncbi:hypothetical protein HMY34_01205 [Thiothrix subterranea]|uniref:hypothetical protein n=1 Tax=Thiothrix subterranea TaxID=2735563 RepID=UPI00192BE033|nr:hypothetical protein [Thiothrix subterranea]QQZ27484.1 hypothetical protein HMY34_01205 [Thiothrix subterranea]